jgi:hypothetical protein
VGSAGIENIFYTERTNAGGSTPVPQPVVAVFEWCRVWGLGVRV